MSVNGLTPILYASDFAASMAYFVERLGFRKLWEWGEPPDFGGVGRDQIEIFLCGNSQGQPGTWMSIFVDDVDELHDEFLKRGAVIRSAPVNEPWGMREMLVECPDGHVLRFGQGLPTAPERLIERRSLEVRIESRLASLVEDLAARQDVSVGQLLEEILLHSFERIPGKNGQECSAAPYTSRTFRLIDELKRKHGIDYDCHANYGFIEKPPA